MSQTDPPLDQPFLRQLSIEYFPQICTGVQRSNPCAELSETRTTVFDAIVDRAVPDDAG